MSNEAGIVCRDCSSLWRDSPPDDRWHRVEWIAPDAVHGAVFGEYFLCKDCHDRGQSSSDAADEEQVEMPEPQDPSTDAVENLDAESVLITEPDYRALALDLAVTLACGLEEEHDAVGVTRIADVFVTWLEAGSGSDS